MLYSSLNNTGLMSWYYSKLASTIINLLFILQVSLHEYNGKHSQFRILPRYKVKSEGEVVSVILLLLSIILFVEVKS